LKKSCRKNTSAIRSTPTESNYQSSCFGTDASLSYNRLRSNLTEKFPQSDSCEKDDNMDAALKAKLAEARERMNSQQAGINANRKHDDPAMREWARGKQRPANAERAQFRDSLTDEDRSQIEERIEQLVHDNPTLSPTNARALDSETEPPSVSVEVLDEYYFLRDILA